MVILYRLVNDVHCMCVCIFCEVRKDAYPRSPTRAWNMRCTNYLLPLHHEIPSQTRRQRQFQEYRASVGQDWAPGADHGDLHRGIPPCVMASLQTCHRSRVTHHNIKIAPGTRLIHFSKQAFDPRRSMHPSSTDSQFNHHPSESFLRSKL